MSQRLKQITKLLTGQFIPFLKPAWDQPENETFNRWMKGEPFQGSADYLEDKLKKLYGNDVYIKTLNLGRSAIQTALEIFQLEKGSEVILPSFGCTGTLTPIVQAGHKPVLVDSDENFNISLKSIKEAYSEKVKAILMPHLSGLWANDALEILAWAKEKNIFVIEDCALALGLTYNDKLAGLFGDVGIFSCHGGKPIHNSAGAWIITKNPQLGERLNQVQLANEPEKKLRKRMRCFHKLYFHSNFVEGYRYFFSLIKEKLSHSNGTPSNNMQNYLFDRYTISDIEARLIGLQLDSFPRHLEKSRQAVDIWTKLLKSWGFKSLKLLPIENNTFSKMLIAFDGENAEQESKDFRHFLNINSIQAEASYTPLHLRPPFSQFRKVPTPVLDKLWKTAFVLPTRPNLSESELNSISKVMKK